MSSSSSSNGDGDGKDFKSRFQKSLALQQQNIDDRIKSRLKSEPSPPTATEKKPSTSMVGSITQSLKGLWGDVLQASKMHDLDTIAKTKKKTGTEYFVDQPGLVASRIESFEKLHMQNGASIEQLTATMAAGYSRLKSGTLSIFDVDDIFEVGSTKLYRLQQLVSSDRMAMVLAFIKESGNTCAFCAGVYGDEKTYTRLLDITAVGITSETNPPDIFVALTISLVAGQETKFDAYGTKKVVVAMKEGEEPLLEKTFNIVPHAPPPPPAASPKLPAVTALPVSPTVVMPSESSSSSSSSLQPSSTAPPSLSPSSPSILSAVTVSSPHLPAVSGSPVPINISVPTTTAISPTLLLQTTKDTIDDVRGNISLQSDNHPSLVQPSTPKPISSSSSSSSGSGSGSSDNHMNVSQDQGQTVSITATPTASSSIVVDGRKLSTRRHRDFIARQQSTSDATNGTGLGNVSNGAAATAAGYHGVVLRPASSRGGQGAATTAGLEMIVDATEIYMTEVPEGHEVKMTISPFMLSSKTSSGAGQEIYIKRSGSTGRADTLALHYDATLLAGCYQLDATHRAELEAQQQSSHDSTSEAKVEAFVIGSTRTFVRSHLDQKARTALLASMKAQEGRPRMLTSGVFGGRDGRPPIDLTAVAIYSSQAELFISLAIHPTPGNETNPDALGVRKVVVFTGDGGMPIMERIFNVVAKEGTEGMYIRPTTSYVDDDDDFEEHDDPG